MFADGTQNVCALTLLVGSFDS